MILLIKGQVQGYTRRDGTYVGPHFRSAAKFAAAKHQGQLRKDGKTPYISHPVIVADILRRRGGVEDPHTLAAAVLHDTIEDTDTSYDELRSIFGQRVADMVVEVSDDKSLSKEERKRAQIGEAPYYSPGAAQIKIADKIANMTDIIRIPPPWPTDRKRGYYEHARSVVGNMREPHPILLDLFETVYQEGLKRIQ